MESRNESQYIIINFYSCLNLKNISNSKQVLTQALVAKKPIIFNAIEVNEIDTASLQLLLSFTQVLKQQNTTWEWHTPSHQLLYIAKLLGCHKLLNLPD